MSDESQSLYRGTNVGYDYFDLDVARLRFLGGTSNHWAGWCRPLDAYDFETHDHIERSGRPIDISDLEPYLPEARGHPGDRGVSAWPRPLPWSGISDYMASSSAR